jgi:glutamate N-acetyltransferase / amino-acid N-acetyltransferase
MKCPGFRFSAARAGIKERGALDLGLIASDRPASAAAVFTQNRVQAAPVRVSRAALERTGGVAQALIVNSGNANACTGARGMRDARRMVEGAARALELPADRVQVASTGVIGVPLPIEAIEARLAPMAAELDADGFAAFAEAILTTDRGPKIASRSVDFGGKPLTLLGCTKGAGMIAPNMATTLTFIVTDAALPQATLAEATRAAADATYNSITIDGDTSTNDTLLVLAGGAAGNDPLAPGLGEAFAPALEALCEELARALMADGEGVSHVVDVRVRGARSEADARRIAQSIARSSLVKTAIAGGDPNWGRVICAAGNAGVDLDPDALELFIGEVPLVRAGVAVADDGADARAEAVMKRPAYTITLDLHAGGEAAFALACDLSHEYVTINADYRT